MRKLSGIFAGTLALTLVLGMTSFAAPSSSTTTKETQAQEAQASSWSGGVQTVEVDGKSATVKALAPAVVSEVQGTNLENKMKDAVGDKASTSKVEKAVDLSGVTIPSGGAKVTIDFGISEQSGKGYFLLHKRSTDSVWERLDCTFEDGKVSAWFTSLSPVVLVSYDKDDSDSDSDDDDAATTSSSSSSSSSSSKKSPKTGEEVPFAMMAAAAALAGTAVAAKKVRYSK